MAGSANAGLTLRYGCLSNGTKTSAMLEKAGGEEEGTRYRGSFVYEATSDGSERLQSVPWAEGRIVLEHYSETVVDSLVLDEPLVPEEDVVAIDTVVAGGFDPRVCWHVTDHLGSTREVVVLGAGLMGRSAVVESNGYLPFGTRYGKTPGTSYILTEGNSNRYRFSGKEEQRFGWDADACRPVADLGLLDFGARYYDPFTCRWTTPDPLAGKYLSLSPYNYCAGNPVRYVDPDGGIIDTFIDAASLVMGVKSFVSNVKQGNTKAAIVDGVGIVADAAAVAVPFVPGGAGAAIKAVRAGDKAVDAVKAINKADDVADAAKTLKIVDNTTEASNSGTIIGAIGKKGGENGFTRAGREAHKNYNPGPGYKKEQTLRPTKKRADAVNYGEGIVRELKPNNPRAIKKGERQVKEYVDILNRTNPLAEGQSWQGVVDTY